MSFVIFEGDFNPSKVEVAGTEPTLLIPLTLLLFQTLICQVVSDLDQIDSNRHIQTTPLPLLYTELSFQSFHGAFRYISEFCYLSDWIARSQ